MASMRTVPRGLRLVGIIIAMVIIKDQGQEPVVQVLQSSRNMVGGMTIRETFALQTNWFEERGA
ncbi:hypothetical protein SCP_0607430 [Sparassis crispa]|uniref:Uncharacterized protein n=1 Tax=Sparassis crispa TaxID=139825 RepID=A0A401GRC4_9APHY|nr:hypothetical protein SCP_0607430 [Sparassis crispa]GBE84763.1 hypothetical protein SCP_0607430 [Sparassis crispa]